MVRARTMLYDENYERLFSRSRWCTTMLHKGTRPWTAAQDMHALVTPVRRYAGGAVAGIDRVRGGG